MDKSNLATAPALKSSPKRHPDWDTFYQVLYVGPPMYSGTETERSELRAALKVFSADQSDNSQLVKLEPSYALGYFIVWTKTESSASLLPATCNNYQRVYEVTKVN